MSEMLGNYYFHQRKFQSAQKQLEGSLQRNSSDLIRKKLIICYTQSGLLAEAIKMLLELIDRNIDIIINTKTEEENCPCIELIFELENNPNFSKENYQQVLVLGILWLYCDVYKSKAYFLKAYQINPHDSRLTKINKIISSYINNNKHNKSQN